MLSELVDNSRTDKNTTHSYLELYQKLMVSIQYSAKNVLEIGIGDFQGTTNGGSIKLWHDFFTNAKIHALDICPIENVWEGIKDNERIIIYPSTDAYNENLFKINFIDKNIKIDMALDDGPHTLESMKKFITLYSQILTDKGILIIEDIPEISWIKELISIVPQELKHYIQIYNLRYKKNRFDDIVFVINKNS